MAQSTRQLNEKFSLQEVYTLTQGDRNQWGIYGYKVPKTYDYTFASTEFSFPKEKRADATHEAQKRASDPDPTKYAGEFNETQKKSWTSSWGHFPKAKKESLIDSIMKLSSKIPGPGKYEDKKDLTLLKTGSLGKFDKCEKIGFLSTIQALAEETPSTWKYDVHAETDRKRSNWCKTAKSGTRKKSLVGPGYYEKVDDAVLKCTLQSEPKYSIPRAKSARAISTVNIKLKTPGVGTYVDADKIGTMAYKIKTTSRRVIHPYKASRYMDSVVKHAKGVPGPGSYNIGAKLKKNKKFKT